jgi:hypothetical protein
VFSFYPVAEWVPELHSHGHVAAQTENLLVKSNSPSVEFVVMPIAVIVLITMTFW